MDGRVLLPTSRLRATIAFSPLNRGINISWFSARPRDGRLLPIDFQGAAGADGL